MKKGDLVVSSVFGAGCSRVRDRQGRRSRPAPRVVGRAVACDSSTSVELEKTLHRAVGADASLVLRVDTDAARSAERRDRRKEELDIVRNDRRFSHESDTERMPTASAPAGASLTAVAAIAAAAGAGAATLLSLAALLSRLARGTITSGPTRRCYQ